MAIPIYKLSYVLKEILGTMKMIILPPQGLSRFNVSLAVVAMGIKIVFFFVLTPGELSWEGY